MTQSSPTRARYTTTALACALLLWLTACGPVDFASVTLAVREPEGAGRLLGNAAFLNLFTAIDDATPASVSFGLPLGTVSKDVALGKDEHTLHLFISTDGPDAPTSLGRADDIDVPSVNDKRIQKNGAAIFEDREPLILARPGVPELLDRGIPSARRGTAACDEKSGRGWVVGGLDAAGQGVNAYTFDEDDLLASDAFDLVTSGTIACDGDENGGLVVWEPAVVGRQFVHFDAAGEDVRVSPRTPVGTVDTGAFVRVSGNRVWVATAEAVAVFDLATRSPIGNSLVFAVAQDDARFIVVDDDTFVRVSHQSLDLVKLEAAGLANLAAGVLGRPQADVIAADPNSNFVLQNNGDLQTVTVEGTTVSFNNVRSVALNGLEPTEMTLLPTLNRIVMLDHNAGGQLLIEGDAPVASPREHMIRTRGDAVILFGSIGDDTVLADPGDHDKGHDVLILP